MSVLNGVPISKLLHPGLQTSGNSTLPIPVFPALERAGMIIKILAEMKREEERDKHVSTYENSSIGWPASASDGLPYG